MFHSFTVLVIRISDQDGEDVRRNTFTNFTMDTTAELFQLHRRKTVRRSRANTPNLCLQIMLEITAVQPVLGCKFVYFPMFTEQINFSMNTYVMCSHFDTTSTSG